MNKNTKFSRLIIGLLIIICGLKIYSLAYMPIIKGFKLKLHGNNIEGTITRCYEVEKSVSAGNSHTRHVYLNPYFDVSYLDYTQTFIGGRSYDVGDKIKITYLPSNPSISIITEENNTFLDILGFSRTSMVIINSFCLLIFLISLIGAVCIIFPNGSDKIINYCLKRVKSLNYIPIKSYSSQSKETVLNRLNTQIPQEKLKSFWGVKANYYIDQIKMLETKSNYKALFCTIPWLIYNGFYNIGGVLAIIFPALVCNIGLWIVRGSFNYLFVILYIIFHLGVSLYFYYKGNEIVLKQTTILLDRGIKVLNKKLRRKITVFYIIYMFLFSSLLLVLMHF